jgi:hypothetical protein
MIMVATAAGCMQMAVAAVATTAVVAVVMAAAVVLVRAVAALAAMLVHMTIAVVMVMIMLVAMAAVGLAIVFMVMGVSMAMVVVMAVVMPTATSQVSVYPQGQSNHDVETHASNRHNEHDCSTTQTTHTALVVGTVSKDVGASVSCPKQSKAMQNKTKQYSTQLGGGLGNSQARLCDLLLSEDFKALSFLMLRSSRRASFAVGAYC